MRKLDNTIEINGRRGRARKQIVGYTVRIAGHLEKSTLDLNGDVTIDNQSDGDALISGAIPDQARLMKLLLQLHNVGITILSVKALIRRR
jgi:hypothetical protein